MVYTVLLQTRAERDLRALSRYIQAESGEAAAAWLDRLYRFIESLEQLPKRGVVVQERPQVRRIAYGRRPHVYHVFYTVDAAHRTVNVLHIRHGARKPRKRL